MLHKILGKRLVNKLNLIEVNPPDRPFALRIPENQRWTFSEGDYYESNVIYWIELLLKNLKKTKDDLVFYDIGANCAYYSLLASQYAGQVVAFEPSDESSQIVRLNLGSNRIKNISLQKVALTNKAGSVTFHTYSSSGNDSLIRRDIPKGHELKYKRSYQVAAERLDSYREKQQLPLPDIIKMDIEGAELFAFEGAKKTLQLASLPSIVVEYSAATSHDAGYKREDLRDFLLDLGYAVYGISDDNKTTALIPLTKGGKNEKHVSNLVAVAKSKKGTQLLEET